jgi:hypothetical protein
MIHLTAFLDLASSITYPRKVGSSRVVYATQLCTEAPFGHCPACGSLGVEHLIESCDPDINFFCPDKHCRVILGNSAPIRTIWCSAKTEQLLTLELQGSSWNEHNYPGIEFPPVCPI